MIMNNIFIYRKYKIVFNKEFNCGREIYTGINIEFNILKDFKTNKIFKEIKDKEHNLSCPICNSTKFSQLVSEADFDGNPKYRGDLLCNNCYTQFIVYKE